MPQRLVVTDPEIELSSGGMRTSIIRTVVDFGIVSDRRRRRGREDIHRPQQRQRGTLTLMRIDPQSSAGRL